MADLNGVTQIVEKTEAPPVGTNPPSGSIFKWIQEVTGDIVYKFRDSTGTEGFIGSTGTPVLSTVLTGLSLATGTPIVATDTIIVAFGKLQAQINNLTTSDINNFSTGVKNVVLSGLSIVNSLVTSSDTIQEAIGKLQGQINAANFTRIIFSDYIVGTTDDPTTTAQTSGTSTVIAEMTKTFTPADATNKIDVFFSGTFGEDGSNKDETVFIAVFIDGVEQVETRRAQTTKGDSETDKISSLYTQWQGSLSTTSHTIDIKFWIRGAGGATAVALNTQRNLIIKEIDE